MITWLKSLFKPKDPKFPRKVKEHWYCGRWYLYLGDLKDKGEYTGTTLDPSTPRWAKDTHKLAFNPFHTGIINDDTTGLINGLIPALQIGDRIGLYRQIGRRYRTTSHYDGAPWDDGYNIDLVFVHTIPAPEYPDEA